MVGSLTGGGYASAYSFMYSPRPGTPAADMAGQVDDTTKKERLAGLQALLDEQQYAFNKTFEGQTVEVLVEEKTPDGSQLRGRTPHNIVVNFAGHERLIGTRVRVNITQAKPKSLGGEIELVAAA